MARSDESDARARSILPQGMIDQPGLRKLREAVANGLDEVPSPRRLGKEALAGLNVALSSIPDGLASGLLAGVNPIHGLYAAIVAPIVGGALSSTALMVVTTTSAAALTAGQALSSLSSEERTGALFLMTVIVGVLQIAFGVLKLGRLTRYVSYSVMTGFIAGIAVLTVLSQVPTIAGYDADGASKFVQAVDTLAHPGSLNWAALALAAASFTIAAVLLRSRFSSAGGLLSIVVPSLAVAFLGLDSVRLVGDIPAGLPQFMLPSLSHLNVELVTGAFAVAVIVLMQGAGVSQSVPNPDGSPQDASRDFTAQGAANAATGLLSGMPVGASLGSTAISVLSGARSRVAAIFAGLWIAAAVLVVPVLVARVAMPALGALLMLASISTIEPRDAVFLWRTGWPSRAASLTTFLATIFLPIQVAVAMGVALSIALHFITTSADISIVALERRSDGRIEERRPGDRLMSGEVTVLDVYGSLSFAAAAKLQGLLPDPAGTEHPVVVLRLRGTQEVGATLIDVLSSYAGKLEKAGGRLYLSGISARVHEAIVRTGKLELSGPVRTFEATPIVGESTEQAVEDARSWLVRRSSEE